MGDGFLLTEDSTHRTEAHDSDVVRAVHVSFSYASSSQILPGLTLSVRPGECLAMMGPSGCGKTTFLRLVAGLLVPQSGELHIATESISYLQQDDGLIPWMSVLENVTLPRLLAGHVEEAARGAALDAIATVNLSGTGDLYPHQLSGGMKKRIEIARAICSASRLWLLDEPFESLDLATRLRIVGLVRSELAKAQASAIVVTHGIEDVLAIADRVAVLGRSGQLQGVHDIPRPKSRAVESPECVGTRSTLLRLLLDENI